MELHLRQGNCVEKMGELEEGSVDAILCDPPYGLKFMNKEFDDLGEGAQQKEWHIQWVKEAFRVLKKGGVLKAFGGTRTYQHLAAAMVEVGFKDFSVEAWAYGSGFPKSLNISKAFDKKAGKEGKVIGTKRGVGGQDLNDIIGNKDVVREREEGKGGVGAYGTGAKQTQIDVPVREPVTEEAKTWQGWGTALKPSWEPICVGYKK